MARHPLRSPRLLGCLPAVLVALLLLSGCEQKEPNLLRAKRAESRHELVGGPVAYADVGDFVLENDKIRVAILDTERSWGPGVFGGSLVDADIRRKDGRFPEGEGRDRFAEVFPLANLMVPAPLDSEVSVYRDGSDGEEAVIRVEGRGYAMIHALNAIRDNKEALQDFLKYLDVKPEVWFRTDYSLRPGESFVRMKTAVRVPPDLPKSVRDEVECTEATAVKVCGDGLVCNDDGKCACPSLDGCAKTCDAGDEIAYQVDPATGCQVCPINPKTNKPECSEILPMRVATGDESVIGVILGENESQAKAYNKLPPAEKAKAQVPRKGGLGAGDFVFFGKKNKQFVPYNGFDEESEVWQAWFEGRDTFARPLTFDYVAALGGDVSYAYYTVKRNKNDPPPKVAVPVFTSTATPFIAATIQCLHGEADDDSCDRHRVYEFERFLAVGGGDAASVVDIINSHRGVATGTVKGYVRWQDTGASAANASVVVFSNPQPGRQWAHVDDLVAANRAIDGRPGVHNAIDADLGVDPVEDGNFEARLPPGDWVFVPMDEQRIVVGPPISVTVTSGKTHVLLPSLPTPARLHIRATDQQGRRLPAKATLVLLDADGKAMERDGGRRVYLGQGRLGTGVQQIAFTADGDLEMAVAAGRYRLVVSHGFEYGTHDEEIEIAHGQERTIGALLQHEIDTTGWISGDFHLHQQPSFDSGMPLAQRVKTIVAEGVDYAAATDHDVVTDFLPWIKAFGLDQWLASVVGVEISTLDIGHFIGFPIRYMGTTVPAHGAVDWYCMSSNQVFDDVVFNRNGFEGVDEKPTTIIAHPRDGFLGWASQIGLDNFSMTRYRDESLETDTQVFRTVACNQDAMEVFNGKRFDLVHTPTIREIHTFERCLYRIERAGNSLEPLSPGRGAHYGPCREIDHKLGRCDDGFYCVDGKGPVAICMTKAEITADAPTSTEACQQLPGCAKDGRCTWGYGACWKNPLERDLANACPELGERGLTKLTTCAPELSATACKLRHRAVLARVVNADSLVRTKAEQDAWYDEKTTSDPTDAKQAFDAANKLVELCRFDRGCKDNVATEDDEHAECVGKRLGKPLGKAIKGIDQHLDRPCSEHAGAMEDYFRLLEWGVIQAGLGGSDSHASNIEPGLPRTWIRSSTDAPAAIDRAEIARNLRAGKVQASYGPFVTVSVGGAGPGDVVPGTKGGNVAVRIKVQTPSWFGIDRLEVYSNGRLVYSEGVAREPTGLNEDDLPENAIDKKVIGSSPAAIVDLDKVVEVAIPPADERDADSWISVVVMGLGERNWMRPVYLDVPFGELQLPLVASMAFGNVPAISFMFPRPVLRPDFYPVRPYAFTNALFVDTDGNGKYDAPNKRLPFCSPACDPASNLLEDGSGESCTDVQKDYVCLEPERRCGVPIPGVCDVYTALQTGALRSAIGGHGVGSTTP